MKFNIALISNLFVNSSTCAGTYIYVNNCTVQVNKNLDIDANVISSLRHASNSIFGIDSSSDCSHSDLVHEIQLSISAKRYSCEQGDKSFISLGFSTDRISHGGPHGAFHGHQCTKMASLFVDFALPYLNKNSEKLLVIYDSLSNQLGNSYYSMSKMFVTDDFPLYHKSDDRQEMYRRHLKLNLRKKDVKNILPISQELIYNKNRFNMAIVMDARSLPPRKYIDMTKALFHKDSLLKPTNTQIHIFTDCHDAVELRSFKSYFPTIYIYENSSSLVANMHKKLPSMDIVVMSLSMRMSMNTSSLARTKDQAGNDKVVIRLVSRWNASDYSDTMDFNPASLLAGDVTSAALNQWLDMKAFNQWLCNQQLHVQSKHFNCSHMDSTSTQAQAQAQAQPTSHDNNHIIKNGGTLYTAVMVEPRNNHKSLRYVLNNFLTNLDRNWSVVLFHGAREQFRVFAILNETNFMHKHKGRVSLVKLDRDLSSQNDYNQLLYSKQFYDFIPTEVFLVFQTDSAICSRNKHVIYDFLKYDYVGAPWTSTYTAKGGVPFDVGNGGLSLRRKSKMLKKLENCPTTGVNEDVYFSSLKCESVSKPSPVEAMNFSVETLYHENSFGAHRSWHYLEPSHYKQLIETCPEIEAVHMRQGKLN